jgi:hypothetical protein
MEDDESDGVKCILYYAQNLAAQTSRDFADLEGRDDQECLDGATQMVSRAMWERGCVTSEFRV